MHQGIGPLIGPHTLIDSDLIVIRSVVDTYTLPATETGLGWWLVVKPIDIAMLAYGLHNIIRQRCNSFAKPDHALHPDSRAQLIPSVGMDEKITGEQPLDSASPIDPRTEKFPSSATHVLQRFALAPWRSNCDGPWHARTIRRKWGQ
jgi:hypothetical protein